MTDKYTFKDIPVCFPWGSDHLEVTNGILDLMNQAYNEGYEQGAKNIKHFKSSPIFDNEHLVIENEKLKEENKEKCMEFLAEQYYMVRTYSAGVFAGYIKEVDIVNKIIVLKNARRMWYWDGAASLSQLATEGTSNPKNCKFPREVEEVILSGWIEIIPISVDAEASIKKVKIWEM